MSRNVVLFAEKSILPKDDNLFYDVAKFVGVGGPAKPDSLPWAQLRVAVGEWRYDSIFISWLRLYGEDANIYDGYSTYLDTENLESFLKEVAEALLTEKGTQEFYLSLFKEIGQDRTKMECVDIYTEMIKTQSELINILALTEVDYLYLDQDW